MGIFEESCSAIIPTTKIVPKSITNTIRQYTFENIFKSSARFISYSSVKSFQTHCKSLPRSLERFIYFFQKSRTK